MRVRLLPIGRSFGWSNHHPTTRFSARQGPGGDPNARALATAPAPLEPAKRERGARRSLGQVLDDQYRELAGVGTWSARPLRKRQSEQVQYVTFPKVESRIQPRSFEFSGVAFPGQMMAGGTRPAGVSVQLLPSASEPLEPHTMNTTISAPIAAMMAITAPYFRTSSPRRGRDTTPDGTSSASPVRLGATPRAFPKSRTHPYTCLLCEMVLGRC